MIRTKGNHTIEDLIRGSWIDEVDAPNGYSWSSLDRIENQDGHIGSVSELNSQHPDAMKSGAKVVSSMNEYLDGLPAHASWEPQRIESSEMDGRVNYTLGMAVSPDTEVFETTLDQEGYRPFADSSWERFTMNLLSLIDSKAADTKAWEKANRELSGNEWRIKGVVDQGIYEDIIDEDY